MNQLAVVSDHFPAHLDTVFLRPHTIRLPVRRYFDSKSRSRVALIKVTFFPFFFFFSLHKRLPAISIHKSLHRKWVPGVNKMINIYFFFIKCNPKPNQKRRLVNAYLPTPRADKFGINTYRYNSVPEIRRSPQMWGWGGGLQGPLKRGKSLARNRSPGKADQTIIR